MYSAVVKHNSNYYFAGEEVKGSKLRVDKDGTIELFNDEPIFVFPYYGDYMITWVNAWVEVEPDSINIIKGVKV